jgi:hypothetical protein
MLRNDPPTLSPELCRALEDALSRATPWWVDIRIDGVPGGYRVRMRNRRPPHFASEGRTGRGHEGTTACVSEILEALQRFIGRATERAWPTDERLPPITGPLKATWHTEQHRAEVVAWSRAFPQPHSRIERGHVRAWYGPESAPVLSLPPIPLHGPD